LVERYPSRKRPSGASLGDGQPLWSLLLSHRPCSATPVHVAPWRWGDFESERVPDVPRERPAWRLANHASPFLGGLQSQFVSAEIDRGAVDDDAMVV
jgi:hypothetical protein